jgi:succinyl-diaminopimelate desuccinylase
LNPESISATLADLVSINSVNPQYSGGAGEKAVADYVGHFFQRYGIPVEYQPVFENRPNVIAKVEGRRTDRTLILEAHMDTASVLDMTADPFRPERRGNRMYGRGTCDTKGGLAAMMHALKAVSECQPRPEASVLLVAAVDEEYSFGGIAKFVEKGAQADGAIVAEPTSLKIVIATKGVLRWRMQTRGRAAHSAKPFLGINAISKMAQFIVLADRFFPPLFQQREHALLGCPTLNVGVIQGGVQVNQVPQSCSIEVDRRLLPGETREQVYREFEEAISQLRSRDSEFDMEMEPPMLEDQALETSPHERIVEVTAAVSRELTGQSPLVGVPYGTDASKLARAGIPSIVLGPGNIDQAHGSVEYVDLDQVVFASQIYARAMLEF